MKEFWKPKQSAWKLFDTDLIKEEYMPIRLAYENVSYKPKIIQERLRKLESDVPESELKLWEEEMKSLPKRGEKVQYQGYTKKELQEAEEKGRYPVSFMPFNKMVLLHRQRAREGEEIAPAPLIETMAVRVLRYLRTYDIGEYGQLMMQCGYSAKGELVADTLLRRLENSGLIMRPARGKYRITAKGKEALNELESLGIYQVFQR